MISKPTHNEKIPFAEPKNDAPLSTAPAATFLVVSTVLANVPTRCDQTHISKTSQQEWYKQIRYKYVIPLALPTKATPLSTADEATFFVTSTVLETVFDSASIRKT